ncbi:hypothetical protein K491DRAFT_691144 [Lophiostoma macrostomum CBS 122681]|uniref:Uncharacterized protein n=1 Tax=Lophiostoma macrostomum CBS 122681 TaxID=1314788 RepID=A0A6A6TDD4_9PLEO|nr:hypothetical protein K491DRAFT_691144 [Lophiostoma macrostomum CBS 122681]
MSAPHKRSNNLDSADEKDRFGSDGTQDSKEDSYLKPPSGSAPTTPRRCNLSFGNRSGNVTPTTPATPTSRGRHQSLGSIDEHRTLSPTRARGASSPGLLGLHSPTKITRKVIAVIRQVGRPGPDELSQDSPLSQELAKLVVGDKQKTTRDPALVATVVPDIPRLELSNALPPADSLPSESKRVPTWSPVKPKSRASSISSLNALSGFGDSALDSEPIYLTPTSQVPVYPQMGTSAYFKAQAASPFFAFDKLGYLSRSPLSNKVVQLFHDPRTAPEWKATIPDIYAARQKEKGLDLAMDQWVLYWETMIVKADVRRGCELAVKAAELLWSERDQALAEHREKVDRRLTGAYVEGH